ncbi:MAG: MarR family transcriptional regulator [Ahrensia sp.]
MSKRYYIPDEDDTARLMPLVNMIARVNRIYMAKELAGTGLYPGQEGVVEVLGADGELTPSEIALRLGVRPPTITKTISRLEEQGFVERTKSADDARQVHIRLTAEGDKLLKVVKKAMKRSEKRVLSGLKKKDRRELKTILADIARGLAYESDA